MTLDETRNLRSSTLPTVGVQIEVLPSGTKKLVLHDGQRRETVLTTREKVSRPGVTEIEGEDL